MFRELITDIFFDLDHTLWDFEKNSALAYTRVFQENDLKVDFNSFLVYYVPINHEYWKLYREERISKENLRFLRLYTTFEKIGVTLSEALILKIADDYISYLGTYGNLFEGTTDILDYLKPNYRLHIITNGFKEVQSNKLKNSDIQHYFDTVVDSEMVGVKKPNPLIFEYSLNLAHVRPESSLMIGDSLEADILGAKSVGMHTIHFNSNNEEVLEDGITIYNLIDLKNYL